jgi:hypothetical protein
MIRRADHLIAVSDFEADFFSRRLRIARERFAVIQNGARLPQPSADRRVIVTLGPLITKTDVSMQGFTPGERAEVTAVQTGRLAAGTYPVEIGLAPPADENPDIRLAILGEGPWYRLGTIALQN